KPTEERKAPDLLVSAIPKTLLVADVGHFAQSVWINARVLSSVYLKQAALEPPAVEIPFSSTPGILYFSTSTPRVISSATSFSMSSTCQHAWLACDVPAFGVGYRKQAVPLANWEVTPPAVTSLGLKPNLCS